MKLKKKGLLIIGCLMILLIAIFYLIYPGDWDVSVLQIVKCNSNAAFRSIGDTAVWKKWWPGGEVDGYTYKTERKEYPEIGVVLEGERPIPGTIHILRLAGRDSTAVLWKMHFSAGTDPVSRIREHLRSRSWQQRGHVVLDSLRRFLETSGNIYKMEVRMQMSTDSALIMTQLSTGHYPSTGEIYEQIRGMRRFIGVRGIGETDPPMLHVVKVNDSSYRSMIAIPIDRALQEAGPYNGRRFVPWKVMIGEVRGGASRAEEGMMELQNYISDYQYTIMAIPFESLVTERDQERDSSRWITRVVVPVP